MAVAGGGLPCNTARLRNGRIEFIAITQNRPKDQIPALWLAAKELENGRSTTVDARFPYMYRLAKLLGLKQYGTYDVGTIPQDDGHGGDSCQT